ncbi:YbaB/EbfC family nucleoid-associated protein [Nocardia sp. CDC159]|uniref:YbaB/EbfC family nucleoid-associated protein n=1 Tax=Nocardia pulmonis TaxID=2951408 RepID=A0A9X2IXJ2_9NOCA|nr:MULTISPECIES: YbaB/EbfC family nucleoid-associated protein [Nocardia]MCM6776077.1 YbaB/EbfC family nucleoid-associated protein [Nocardia pulmonis]MCM6788596.1 YbaB/EbfC family nucleoid-associated protein [Nocardia sp. CDC159]
MTNDRAKADLADLFDTVNTHIRSIAEAQRQRTALTAAASAGEGRVHITVNADGVVIETRFAEDIDDLDYDEIAAAVTEATQLAAVEVARRAEELIAPIRSTRSRLPSLSEIVADLPDLRAKVPEPQRAPMDPPSARRHLDYSDTPRARSAVADDGY